MAEPKEHAADCEQRYHSCTCGYEAHLEKIAHTPPRAHVIGMDGFDMEAARIGRAAFAHLVELDLADDTSNDADYLIEQVKTLVAPSPQTRAEAPDECQTLFSVTTPEDGVLRVAKWPEGWVLWYHGKIVWKSWEKTRD